MKLIPTAEAYLSLRNGALWGLLSADSGPLVLAIFQTSFSTTERTIPYATLFERVDVSLSELRSEGYSLPMSTKEYITNWRNRGWLRRQLISQDSEEYYSLTTETLHALRFVESLLQPRHAATESRLSIVIQQMLKLADATNPNSESKLKALEAEKARIEREIAEVKAGNFEVLSEERALEHIREVINQAADLTQDFNAVRDAFSQLNVSLRQRLLEEDGSRSDVLDAIFDGLDVIADSEAGRSFQAFWRLLTDKAQLNSMEEAIEEIFTRGFAKKVPNHEKRFLQDLTQTLLNEAAGVHSVIHVLSAGLKKFVKSNEYGQNRRLNEIIREAQAEAMQCVEGATRLTQTSYAYESSVAQISSISEIQLKDPKVEMPSSAMEDAPESHLSADQAEAMFKRSGINFKQLRANLSVALSVSPEISLPTLLKSYPGDQGLASVLGYITMAQKSSKCLVDQDVIEKVTWTGSDGVVRSAKVPRIVFQQGMLK